MVLVHNIQKAENDRRLCEQLEAVFSRSAAPLAPAYIDRVNRELSLGNRILANLQAGYVVAIYFTLSVIEGRAGEWFKPKPNEEELFARDVSHQLVQSWVQLMSRVKDDHGNIPEKDLIPSISDLREGLQSSWTVSFDKISDEDLQTVLLDSMRDLARSVDDVELPHGIRIKSAHLNSALISRTPA